MRRLIAVSEKARFGGPNVNRRREADPARIHDVASPCSDQGAVGAIALLLCALVLGGCESLAIHDTSSLLVPRFQRSEVFGFLAGLGTTFAAVPDLIRMIKRQSSKGINPTMAGIIGVFQIVWIYYGLLIASRPVIAWNMIGVIINLLTVGAYVRFARRETIRRQLG
jgi:MtN3 and saliva related transmembrane protein